MILLTLQDGNKSWQSVKVSKCIINCQSLKEEREGQIWTKEASNDWLERTLPGAQSAFISVPAIITSTCG